MCHPAQNDLDNAATPSPRRVVMFAATEPKIKNITKEVNSDKSSFNLINLSPIYLLRSRPCFACAEQNQRTISVLPVRSTSRAYGTRVLESACHTGRCWRSCTYVISMCNIDQIERNDRAWA
uniref:Uncharacterized protein n=1 Tax=Oryza brachyantha TaxID=4533 RepID=J3LKT6_ORYBR